ncbi:DUF2490 domain-containing protein [Dokdonia sp. Hel_I_53]|uniref:DUF2490 domain-containing protein n=1 Tax=Dokdonia sp. Hel_I_53 TaxID=1566287 RepID=UPI00119A5D43|nr:DUF2490 domain-containing protein [Dokdonia sp. Hel_I_53]TVZ51164.1 uncharacterized protein DUF2490 [Dokdonia sp. Hel_I_53]
MFLRKYITFIILGITLSISAQNRGEDKLGSWAMLFTQNQISEKLSIHAEAQYRTYEFGDNFNQLLLRTALNYHISEKAMVSFGYGHITTDGTFEEPQDEKNSTENRIYEQFVLKNNLGKFNFSHRYRLEQRFVDNPAAGKSTLHRARYFLRVTYPLSKTWFITAYDEVFINLQNEFFGQNRLYGALGYTFNPQLSLQVGYLKNDFSVDTYDRFQVGLFVKTDLKKK